MAFSPISTASTSTRRQTIGIRADRYKAEVPTVTGPIRRKGPVHKLEASAARAHTQRKLKFTLPGPMTIADTIADEHYRDRPALAHAFAAALNEEARELEALGVDVVQFDEPAFNVYMRDVKDWGVAALERAAQGLRCRTAVHICYGYGIKANNDWKATLGEHWRQYEETFPALAASRIDQVSLECRNARVPIELIGLLKGKDVMVGCIDVASNVVETPQEVADTIRAALDYVPPERLYPCTNCGMAPMATEIAYAKLAALAAGAELARKAVQLRAPFQSASNSRPRVSGSASAAAMTIAYAIAAKMPIAAPSATEADTIPTSVGKNAPMPRPKL